jgi:hypothetical protein
MKKRAKFMSCIAVGHTLNQATSRSNRSAAGKHIKKYLKGAKAIGVEA